MVSCQREKVSGKSETCEIASQRMEALLNKGPKEAKV